MRNLHLSTKDLLDLADGLARELKREAKGLERTAREVADISRDYDPQAAMIARGVAARARRVRDEIGEYLPKERGYTHTYN
ncbi:hypothetical protein HYT52_02020 [Candidatus Woesearchaeota archaeon]|nr:hypothetical protein [Candidatus Woesearchaeota archaeon]